MAVPAGLPAQQLVRVKMREILPVRFSQLEEAEPN